MSLLGTEYKINVYVAPVDGHHIGDGDFDFEVDVYVNPRKSVHFTKSELKKVDNDNYYVIVDSEKAMTVGKGQVSLRIEAHIPDADFADGRRTEVKEVKTNILIS